MAKMPFLSGELTDSYILSHDKRLREGATKTTKENNGFILRGAVSDRDLEVRIFVREVRLLLGKEL